MLLAMTYVVLSLMELNDQSLFYKILTVSLIFIQAFGLGGFQANIIQFGVDQLNDASTTEITSFVAWYTWTFISSNATISFTDALTCLDSKYYLIGPLLIVTCLTIVVSTNYLFSNQIIKEPVTQNPFKLIYKVVGYAIRNKYPRQRSAVTYWEDYLPSRLDFGKIKYGGPFTTEQVEDVKMFFKILGIAFIASILVSMNNHRLHADYFSKLLANGNYPEDRFLRQCFDKDFYNNIYAITGLLFIPLNEILLYPLFYRCIVIKSHCKYLLGTFLQLAGFTILITLITYSRSKYIETSGLTHNHTIQCLFHPKSTSLNNVAADYRWFALADYFFALSDTMFIIGTIEFYCAQVPYSMKGLMAGSYYGLLGLCHMFHYGLSQIFRAKLHIWETKTIFSCGFWYLLTKIVLTITVMSMFALLVKYHKKRKREDILPNEHIFAEQYYSVQSSSDGD